MLQRRVFSKRGTLFLTLGIQRGAFISYLISIFLNEEEYTVYQKVDTNMNFVEREKKVEQFWKDNRIFEKSMELKEGCPQYMFYDGPPTANGKPHIGHVLTRVIKE